MIPRLGRGGRGFDSRSPPFAPRGNERRLAHRRARQAGDATRRRKGSKVERLFSSVPCSGESFFQAEKNTKKKKETPHERSTRAPSRRRRVTRGSSRCAGRVDVAPASPRRKKGGLGESNPRPRPPEGRIMPLDQIPNLGPFCRTRRTSHSDFGIGINPSFLG